VSESEWVEITSRLPADGEVVGVKLDGTTERLVTYHAHPVPRWSEPTGSYRVELFPLWRTATKEELDRMRDAPEV
jgi:hypothetical protein